MPSIRDGKIAYATMWAADGDCQLGVGDPDTTTGTTRMMPAGAEDAQGIGQTAFTDDGVFRIEHGAGTDPFKAAVARTDADGTNRTTVVPQPGEGSLSTWLCGDSG
ncbi:hypothetical protein [Streptomyces parvus]|uniref:hypothetical protein n=1 Tax=Streptomyces parvus TaxID=66428 RepID=UPI0021012544|nr:hypothetical protein [Streptomyces parvus]MCQ1581460.1 hypothetical protein [Streptomyces parvus]